MQVWGTDGDIRPMIALGAGLKSAGHQVTIIIASIDNKSYAGLCAKTGITMIKSPQNMDVNLDGITGMNGRPAKSIDIMNSLLERALYPYLPELFSASKQLCERNDLVIGHFSGFYLKAAAKIHNIPYISVSYWPGLMPSSTEPPFFFPYFGKIFPKISWAIILTVFDMLLKKKINKFYSDNGLPPVKHIMTGPWMSEDLNLAACSRIFYNEPKDWQASGKIKITGFWNIPVSVEHCDFTTELKDFLARRGEHPVFMTLGSSLQMNPLRCMETLIEAARIYKKKVIIQSGIDKYRPNTFLQNIYFSGRMPHREILPFCLASVHHCGAGTTQTVTRAGIPSVPLYFMDEQKSWGGQLFKLGIASKPLNFLKTTPAKIADAMKLVVNSLKMKDNAGIVAEKMHAEDGVKEAVSIINDFMAKRTPVPAR
jgi:UDP:flavonoid glycosyltransferase YjiC (YdhE family)